MDTGSVNDSMIKWELESEGRSFEKNDIIIYNNKYWYALKNHIKNTIENEPIVSSEYWGGIILVSNKSIPHFIWTPSYTSAAQHKPFVSVIRFGNGYEQRINKSINPDLQTFQLTFDQRTKREARAIVHFLKEKAASKSFAFNPGDIYSETTYRTRYVCREWETTFTFKENYSIRAKFEEVSA